MTQIKFGVWNVEWLNDLFTSDGPVAFKDDAVEVRGPRPSNTVAQRRDDVAGVLGDVDTDMWIIVEGPNRASELQLFFDSDMDGDWLCDVQPTKGSSQIIGIAVRTDTGTFADPPFTRTDASGGQGDNALSKACQPFPEDIDGDGIDELYKFERLPLYARVHLADGTQFGVLGLHLKSKGIFTALEWSQWWSIANSNRMKILAQCKQLRLKFLDPHLTEAETKEIPLIVCGDINDGPGMDTSERRLNASGVEHLMGSVWKPTLTLGNVLFDALDPEDQVTVDLSEIHTTSFKDPIFDRYRKVWLDHILYSRNVSGWLTGGKVHRIMSSGNPIWEDFPHASDHFPVSADLDTNPGP